MRFVLFALLLVLMLAPSAWAHTSLLSTSPSDGASLERAPGQIVAVYNDPLGAPGTAEVSVAGRDIAGEPRLDTADRRRLIIPLTERVGGVHRASWTVVAADGHSQAAEATFRVTSQEPEIERGLRALAGQLMRAAGALRSALPGA